MGTLAVDPRRNPEETQKTKKMKKPRVPWSNPGCFFVRDRTALLNMVVCSTKLWRGFGDEASSENQGGTLGPQ